MGLTSLLLDIISVAASPVLGRMGEDGLHEESQEVVGDPEHGYLYTVSTFVTRRAELHNLRERILFIYSTSVAKSGFNDCIMAWLY